MELTREMFSNIVNNGADLVTDTLSVGERETDIANLIVNAIMTLFDNPDATFDDMVEECFSEGDDPREWWSEWS